MPEKECKQILLNNVWRTCNKIRAALFRSHLDITGVFTELDPHRCSLISESKFVSVLRGRLKHLLGLSDQEIIDLADYFKVQDGRILYTQFCEVIKNEGNNELVKTKPLVSGLEWEEPYHVNCLSVTEERRLRVLLTKMATTVSARRLLLRPFFQDYELVSKNNGSVTLAHFSRVLSFLKIYVSDKDFCLLVKKFMRDGYTMNYIAFIAALEAITQELMEKGMFDLGGDLLSQFPGRILTAELPKLPRPEIGTVPTEKAFGVQTVFHPILIQPRADKDLYEVILRIQRYVLSERVRVGEFFRDFDPLHCGKISESSFRRCLESVGIGESGTRKLYLSPPEIRGVIDLYRDPNDPTRIMWRIFECDIDSVFTTRGLEKWPDKNNDSPPSEVMNLIKPGNKWQEVTQDLRDNCEDVIGLVKRKVLGRRLALRPPFNDCDRCKNGHVSRRQFRTILMSNGIILTNEQMYFLEQRYNDDLGFNYFQFLNEIELQETEPENLTEMYQLARLKLSSQLHPQPVSDSEKNIICVLAKIKKHVACYRMQICQFMSQHDTCKEMSISANDFRRSLDPKLKLTPTEVDTIVEVFRSAGRPGYVDYQRFCDIVEEAFTQKELHRSPLVQPIPHVSHEDGEHNFLDFQERQTVSTALQKIAQCNHESLIDFYRSMDRTNSGVIPESSVMRGLSAAKLHTVVSAKEAETIVKCFSKIQGIYPAFNYVAFCNAIDYVGRAMKGPAL